MKKIYILIITSFLAACSKSENDFDATGTFEANEVIVSAEASGKILSFMVNEGELITYGKVVGTIDDQNLQLQKQQVEASVAALNKKTLDEQPQIALLNQELAVRKSQLNTLIYERARIERLLKQDAATGKQLDDLNAQIDVLQKQILVTKKQIVVQQNNISTQNRSVLSEAEPLNKRVAQIDDLIKRASITNPISGTVLTKYAEAGEITNVGKALYKIADLSELNLKAYVSGAQLSEIKLGQKVIVKVDKGANDYKELDGKLIWISDKAEFTPKTIQTKDERANLVYAIKVKVKNDGYLKIGMYGEVLFNK